MCSFSLVIPRYIYTYFKKGCFSDACFIDRSASCFWIYGCLSLAIIVHVVLKQEQIYIFLWFGFLLESLKREKRSMHLFTANMMLCGLWNKDHVSCITEATLFEIGVYTVLGEWKHIVNSGIGLDNLMASFSRNVKGSRKIMYRSIPSAIIPLPDNPRAFDPCSAPHSEAFDAKKPDPSGIWTVEKMLVIGPALKGFCTPCHKS